MSLTYRVIIIYPLPVCKRKHKSAHRRLTAEIRPYDDALPAEIGIRDPSDRMNDTSAKDLTRLN